MKQLGEVAKNTVTTATQVKQKHSTSSHGLTKTDGSLKPRLEAQPTIREKSQAIQVRSMMRRSEPNSNYDYVIDENGYTVKKELEPLTQGEIDLANEHKRPASKEQIISHLQRLAMHKRMDSNDQDRNAYIFADYASRLHGVTEIEVYSMCEHFIENDHRRDSDRPFFPTLTDVNLWIYNNFKHCGWSGYIKKIRKDMR